MLMRTYLVKWIFICAAALFLTMKQASALVEIDINKANIEPLPVAITDFVSNQPVGKQISDVIEADLKRSGLFRPLARSAYIQKITDPNATPRFADWTIINAQALITGGVTREADGRLRVEFRLWDSVAGQQLIGQRLFAQSQNWRRVAHIISDLIYERLTGEKGYFDTRIVFVSESGPKTNRIK